MTKPQQTLVILSPAFAEAEGDSWLPAQESFVRTVNSIFPALKIIIVTFHFPATKKQYAWYGNEVIALGGGLKGKWNSLLLWRSAWKTLQALRKQYELIGLFSFFCSECAFIGHHFAKRHKLKHHIWILGQDAKSENKQVKRIRPLPGELIAISDFLVREFERNHGIKPSHMIPLGLQSDEFSRQGQERHIDLLGVGSLIPLKQYGVFIDVVKSVQQQFPDIKAIICGDGEMKRQLEQQIDTLHLNAHVALAGKLSRPEILQLMQQSKILLHPSSYEGFGMVCAEALYTGAHVISFCKPMDQDFAQWHIVKSKEEMIAKTLGLMSTPGLAYVPELTFDMKDTAKNIITLFHYKETSAS